MKHVTRVVAMGNEYSSLVRNLNGRVHSGDLGVDGRIILEWTLGK